MPNFDLEQELEDIEHISKQNLRNLLRCTYMLGLNVTFASARKRFWLRLILFLVLLSTGIGWVGCVCYIWQKRHDFSAFADTMCAMLQSVISVIKITFVVFVEQRICKLLRIAETSQMLRPLGIFDLDIACKRELLRDIGRILRKSWLDIYRQLCFYIFVTNLICGWYFLSCIVINISSYFGNDKEQFEWTLPLASTFTFLFKSSIDSFPAFILQYIFSGMPVYVAGVGGIAFDGIFVVLTVHCMALLEILKKILEKTTRDASVPSELRECYLIHCIILHERIYCYFEMVQETFYLVSLSQFGLSSLILCSVLFQASVGLETNMPLFVKMLFYLSAAGFQIFIYCFNGQRLTNRSQIVPYAFYNNCWYNESHNFRLFTHMMILRSDRELVLNVGGFATMSFETLVVFMQTCSSYFLLLRNVNSM